MLWLYRLDDALDGFADGDVTEKEILKSVSKYLSQYARFKELLPEWMIQMTRGARDKKTMIKLYRNAYDAAQDILTHDWDPIGVGYAPMAQDEYDAYIPGAIRMLINHRTDQEMAEYLEKIETDRMGLTPNKERNLRVARRLREAINPFL